MKTRLKDERSNAYGPWVVDELLPVRYAKNGTARFAVHCKYCGYKKIYMGNTLRFDHYAHKCKGCGME